MRDSLTILYLANIGSIFLLYVGIWVQDRRPHLRYFTLGWLLYFLSYGGYFLLSDSGAYRVYAEVTYYASSVLLYMGMMRLLDRPISRAAKIAAAACVGLGLLGRLAWQPGDAFALLPAAAINTALFWTAGFHALRVRRKTRVLLLMAAVGLFGWGAGLLVYPFAYSSIEALNAVSLAVGGFALLLMLDLVALHYAVVNEELTKQTDHIAYLTYHEVMTGLFNRNYLNLKLLHGDDGTLSLPVSLVLFDIDGLKQVNDNLGHKAGDELVVQFASLLRSSLRDKDLALRIGGDEFLLVLPRTDGDGATAILNRIRSQAETGLRRPISFSAGIAVKESDGDRLDLLLQDADAQMYAQKERRKRQARTLIEQYIARV